MRRVPKAALGGLSAAKGRRRPTGARSRDGRELARDRQSEKVDQRLSQVAGEVLAGNYYESPWELFRLQYFSGWEHDRVAGALVKWSARHGFIVRFGLRTVHDKAVFYVCIRV